jgi:hypothetical protein
MKKKEKTKKSILKKFKMNFTGGFIKFSDTQNATKLRSKNNPTSIVFDEPDRFLERLKQEKSK